MPNSIYPRWVSTSEEVMLREVAKNLYIGGCESVRRLQGEPWAAVIDLYGTSGEPARAQSYDGVIRAPILLRWPFDDGIAIPFAVFDAVLPLVAGNIRSGPVLIHCQAGLSRSASVAYALLRTIGGLTPKQALSRVYAVKGFPRKPTLASAEKWAKNRSK
jgi:hypothetical protein